MVTPVPGGSTRLGGGLRGWSWLVVMSPVAGPGNPPGCVVSTGSIGLTGTGVTTGAVVTPRGCLTEPLVVTRAGGRPGRPTCGRMLAAGSGTTTVCAVASPPASVTAPSTADSAHATLRSMNHHIAPIDPGEIGGRVKFPNALLVSMR